jgi:hypothetical protein
MQIFLKQKPEFDVLFRVIPLKRDDGPRLAGFPAIPEGGSKARSEENDTLASLRALAVLTLTNKVAAANNVCCDLRRSAFWFPQF